MFASPARAALLARTVVVGLIGGALHGALVGRGGVGQVVAGAGWWGLGGVVAGVALVVVGAISQAIPGFLALRAAWDRGMDRQAEDRTAVVLLHARLLASAGALAGVLAVAVFLMRMLAAITVAGLAEALMVVGVGLAAVGAALVWVPASAALERLVGWVDGRVRLPWPGRRGARFALYALIPVGGSMAALLALWHEHLGVVAAAPIGLLLLLGLAAVSLLPPPPGGLRTVVALCALGPVLLVGQAAARWSARPPAAAADGPTTELPGKVPVFHGAVDEEHVRPWNILWILIDAVRPDRMGPQRPGGTVTPNLDRLVAKSWRFERAYTPSPSTLHALPGMLTGVDPGELHWIRWRRYRYALKERSFASYLPAKGYTTGAVTVSYLKKHRFWGGIDHFLLVKGKARMEHGAAYVTSKAIQFLERTARGKNRPFFLFAYYPDPHHKYVTHVENEGRFKGGELERYDGELAYTDRYIGFLLDHLRVRGLSKKTIVVITSDHGEQFGEHGKFKHANSHYDVLLEVPLIVHVPGMKPQVISEPVSLVDIVPTLLELTGRADQADQDSLSGQSLLVPALAPERVQPRILYSTHNWERAPGQVSRSLRADPYTVLRDRQGRFEVYDTSKDPGQLHDLEPTQGDDPHIRALKANVLDSMTGNLFTLWDKRKPRSSAGAGAGAAGAAGAARTPASTKN